MRNYFLKKGQVVFMVFGSSATAVNLKMLGKVKSMQ